MSTGLLEEAVGGDPVTLTVGTVALPGSAVGPVTVRRGRTDPDERFAAATLSTTVDAGALTAPPELGDSVQLTLTAAAAAYFGITTAARTRFVGRVTDTDVTPGARITGPPRYGLVAAGVRARLEVKVGDVPWPAELDGARATAILTAAAARLPELTVTAGSPGTVTVFARDVDAQPASGLLDELAESTGGELLELRNGSVTWRDAASRTNVAAALTLDAGNVLAGTSWSQRLAGLVTDLELGYSAADPQPAVRVVDTAAEGRVGAFEARQRSQLADEAAAQSRAVDVVGRRSRPRWRIESLGVDALHTLPVPTAAALLEADVAVLVALTGFPAVGPFTQARLWLEGWTETLTRDGYRFELDVTDYAATATAPRWADVPTAVLWQQGNRTDPWYLRRWPATVPAELSWLGAVGWDPGQVDAGRWADEPADVTWSAVSATQTWATTT